MQGLAGKVAIVTGASRGIGAAAALALGEAGASVVLAARTVAQAEANARQIDAAGGKAVAMACDVSDYAACQRLVHETTQRFGPPDVLVNNAGVIEPIGMVGETDPTEWARSIEINLIGAYYAIRAVLPGMIERGAWRHHQCLVGCGAAAAGGLERVLCRQGRAGDADALHRPGAPRRRHPRVRLPARHDGYRHAGDDPRLRHQHGQQDPARATHAGGASRPRHRVSVHAGGGRSGRRASSACATTISAAASVSADAMRGRTDCHCEVRSEAAIPIPLRTATGIAASLCPSQ